MKKTSRVWLGICLAMLTAAPMLRAQEPSAPAAPSVDEPATMLPHDDREYFRLGGLGFLLGDGGLRYGRETIVESYYTAHVWRGLFASAGAQFIAHPGYNADRGPVFVQMARLHIDF